MEIQLKNDIQKEEPPYRKEQVHDEDDPIRNIIQRKISELEGQALRASGSREAFLKKQIAKIMIFRKMIMKMTIFSRANRQNDDFITKKGVKMTTFSRKSRQNDDFFMKKSSTCQLFLEKIASLSIFA